MIFKVKSKVFIILTILVCYSFAEFSDDFSNPATSNTQWVKEGDFITIEFKNGTCKVINNNNNYIGRVLHTFPTGQKPSIFTLSAEIEIVEGSSAGLAFCLKSGFVDGYYATIEKNYVTVTKINSEGKSEILFNGRSAFINEKGVNQLKISKKESTFNIFCNNTFTGIFTDNAFSSGEIALLVNTNTTAIFDNLVMTDVFTEGKPLSCFTGNFDREKLIGWSYFGDDSVEKKIFNNSLVIKTKGSQNAYLVVDMPLVNFVARVVVSYHSGSTKNLYGLFICGEPTSTTIPMIGFGINGGRQYAVFKSGEQFTANVSSAIKGAPFVSENDTFYYKDTLEIIKRESSPEYLFVVNSKDTLSKFTGVDFGITGIGVFCLDSIEVFFDDFIAAEGTEFACNGIITKGNFSKRGISVTPSFLLNKNKLVLFDCIGRTIKADKNEFLFLRSGIYLTGEAKVINIPYGKKSKK